MPTFTKPAFRDASEPKVAFANLTGECVSGNDCTTEVVLPPGMAIGRPFFTVGESPTKAAPINVMSDWVVEL